jgi:hypothetical protein
MSDDFSGWRFDAKNEQRRFEPPRVVPDARPATSVPAGTFLWSVVALGLLGFCEGTLAWVALRWAHTLGWLAEPPGWAPVVGIALAVTYFRGFDRAVFNRQ